MVSMSMIGWLSRGAVLQGKEHYNTEQEVDRGGTVRDLGDGLLHDMALLVRQRHRGAIRAKHPCTPRQHNLRGTLRRYNGLRWPYPQITDRRCGHHP